mgnify:CR=1 FL=1
MKKMLVLFTVLILMCSLALAGQIGIHEPGTGIDDPELKAEAQGTGQGLEEPELIDSDLPEPELYGQEMKVKVQAGNHMNEQGQQMKIQMQENNKCQLEVEGIVAECPAEMKQEKVQEKTKLYMALSNGKNAEIKVMPNTASETALARLKMKVCAEENGCQIELKEVGSGEETKMAYELKTQRNSRVLGMFKARMNVEAQVDAETGELIKTNKPWWAFLASEKEE